MAKERCLNWFFKISCIRELVPRIYIEASLLRCYTFIKSDQELSRIASRLGQSIRGIGDPLCSAYSRAFVAKNARLVVNDRSYLQEMLKDYITVMADYCSKAVNSTLGIDTGEMGIEALDALHAPAFDIVLHVAGAGASKEEFDSLLEAVQSGWPSPGFLRSILLNFRPTYASQRVNRDLLHIVLDTMHAVFDELKYNE